MPETEDPIIAIVCADLKLRSELGIAKYGTTLARTDLGRQEWLQHLYEELLDAAAYVKRLMVKKNEPEYARETGEETTIYGAYLAGRRARRNHTPPDNHLHYAEGSELNDAWVSGWFDGREE